MRILFLLTTFVFANSLFSNAQSKGLQPAVASSLSAPDHKNDHQNDHNNDARNQAKNLPKRVFYADELRRRALSHVKVVEDGAVIRGHLDLSYLVLEQQVSLTHCDFQDEVDFSFATFKRHLVLDGSTFRKGVTLKSMTADLDARFDDTNFPSGEVLLHWLQVHGVLAMRRAHFADGVKIRAEGLHFDRVADFSDTVFGDEVHLSSVEAHSDLFFDRVTFLKQFSLAIAKISGSLFFREANFFGMAGFPGSQVAYNLRLDHAVFKNRANLSDMQINSFLELSGAKFEYTDKPANFLRASVAAGGFFDNVEFAGGAIFEGTHFNAAASFRHSVFERDVTFYRARFDQGAHFEQCTFRKNASFEEASFGTLDFSKDGRVSSKDEDGKEISKDQFGEHVDLRGCTYNSIQLDWKSVFRMPDGTPRFVGKIEKQPFFQLQKTYEATGDDASANDILLEWHRVKRQHLYRQSKRDWLIDCIPWLTSDYGVDPARLVEISFVLLFFGMLIFSRPGAVCPRVPLPGTDVAVKAPRLRHWDAAAVSLHQFLPLEVPFGSQWSPADDPVTLRLFQRDRGAILLRMRPSSCATFLKVCGYILVPLEIVVLNELLRPGM